MWQRTPGGWVYLNLSTSSDKQLTVTPEREETPRGMTKSSKMLTQCWSYRVLLSERSHCEQKPTTIISKIKYLKKLSAIQLKILFFLIWPNFSDELIFHFKHLSTKTGAAYCLTLCPYLSLETHVTVKLLGTVIWADQTKMIQVCSSFVHMMLFLAKSTH